MVILLDFILLFFLFTEKLLREGFCTDLPVFFGKNDAEAETPVLWPSHAKSWLIGKDSDTGRDWGQEEKGTTEDEMAGWHHWLDGRESQWTPGVGDGQGGLACCDSWGSKEFDTTERMIWSDITYIYINITSIDPIGEGNGNPLQCSCLENPRDGAAWWAAVYGVAKSRTWLSDWTELNWTNYLHLYAIKIFLLSYSWCKISYVSGINA